MEIMVAITISLILLAGIIQIFTASKATYRMQDGLSRVQENGRYAMYFIGRQAREAGFLACATGELGTVTNRLNATTNPLWNFDLYVEGYEASGTGVGATYNITATNPTASASASGWSASASASGTNLPAYLVGSAIPGSDVLIVRSAGPESIKIDRDTPGAQMFIEQTSFEAGACPGGTDRISGLCIDDIAIATDCSESNIFQITNFTGVGSGACATASACANVVHAVGGSSPGNSPPPSWSIGAGGQILKMKTVAYYVGVGASGAPALFYRENNGAANELIDNVESMQILYGEDTDTATSASYGLPNKYVTADNVSDFTRVVTLRISLLMRTPENSRSSDDTGTYLLTGATAATATTINPVDDRRLRRVYTSTIKLRNMGVR